MVPTYRQCYFQIWVDSLQVEQQTSHCGLLSCVQSRCNKKKLETNLHIFCLSCLFSAYLTVLLCLAAVVTSVLSQDDQPKTGSRNNLLLRRNNGGRPNPLAKTTTTTPAPEYPEVGGRVIHLHLGYARFKVSTLEHQFR